MMRERRWLLLLVGVTIVALILLSGGLSRLELLPGGPLPRRAQVGEAGGGGLGSAPGSGLLELLFGAFFLFSLLLMPFAIIHFIVSPEARRRVLRSLALLLWLVALYLLARARPDLFRALQIQAPASQPSDAAPVPGVDFAADPPAWAVTVATIGLAVVLAAAVVGAGWYAWGRRHRPSPLARLAEEAQEAIDALYAGADLRDTVMRCYFEMGHVLSAQRGLRREAAMTPREFAQHLRDAGLAAPQVEQLTRLFEAVRYGGRVPGEKEEEQAIACLSAVVAACRSPS